MAINDLETRAEEGGVSERFKIYLPARVQGDWPIGHHLIAEAGIHDAVANQYGAVSVVLPSGELLGVKPGEFERNAS